MELATEISNEQGVINRLTAELKQTRLPARTINWQHNNIGATKGITQRVLVVRKQRKKINSRVDTLRRKIMSLRKAILGVE